MSEVSSDSAVRFSSTLNQNIMPLYLTSRLLGRSILSLLFLGTINPSGIAQAQVVPDGKLPTNVEQIEMIRKITGGERVGNNLFHSFEEFSIPTGMEVIFENATDIQNIFSRITGSEASFIDGLLKTAGSANFFLINPNGIVFGENARLDIGGSFIGTTGNSIEFADGTTFIASGDNGNVSLSVTLPVGINFNGGNGIITVNGSGNQISNDANTIPIEFLEKNTNLSVQEGKTFALIGNQINFDKGVISSEGSNIYLNSIEKGSVQINEDATSLNFSTDKIQKYQNINLSNQALINSNKDIFVIGKNISLQNGSVILNNQSETQQSLGSINIKAAENITVEVILAEINSSIRSETTGETKGADINITAPNVQLNNQGSIRAITIGDSDSGSININDSSLINVSASNMSTYTSGNGQGGEILFNTKQLKLGRDSSVSTFSGGFGNAGSIEFNTEKLTVGESSIISSIAEKSGNAGEININAVHAELIGNNINERSSIASSSVSADPENPGNAGSVTINTNVLKVEGGNTVSSSSFGTGDAGNVILNASDFIQIEGEQDGLKTTVRSSVDIFTTNEQARISLGLPKVPSGNSGNVSINTPNLEVDDLATISVENVGIGNGGRLTINAENISLSNQSQITAAAESGIGGNIELITQNLNISNDSLITASAGREGDGGNITINTTNLTAKKNNNITASSNEGDGGNITINADSVSLNNQDAIAAASSSGNGGNLTLKTQQLQIENNSLISATAGEQGDGGNITINTDTFTLLDDSQVLANAIRGDGGNITINTAGYFVTNPDNISASSEFGLDGTVEINISEEDLNQSFVLPEYPLVPLEEILAKSCFTARGRDRNRVRLNVLGKGGLPVSPDSGIDEAEDVTSEYTKVYVYSDRSWQPGDPLIQVDQIVTTDDGRLLGVAEARVKKCNQ